MSEEKENLESILLEVKRIKASVQSLEYTMERLLKNVKGKSVLLSLVRKMAILEEVHRAGGIVTSADLEDFAMKWGKSPKGNSGYFSGTNRTLVCLPNEKRALSEKGQEVVLQNRQTYGEDWLDKVDVDIAGNKDIPEDMTILL